MQENLERPHNRTCHLVSLFAAVLLATGSGCGMVATGKNMQGVRLYQKGDYYAAMDRFQRAMSADPDDADAYYNLGATLHRLGKTNKDQTALTQAETYFNRCLDHDPDHADCYRALAVLLVETDRTDRAFVLLKNWAVRSPQNADSRIELARLYEEFGDKKSAELHLQQALQMDQTNQRAWTAMAHLRESRGDLEQAMANYQRAYSLNNYSPAISARIAALNRAVGGSAHWRHYLAKQPDAHSRRSDAQGPLLIRARMPGVRQPHKRPTLGMPDSESQATGPRRTGRDFSAPPP